jgi:hypothetical protein
LDTLKKWLRKGYKSSELYLAACDVPSLFMTVAIGQLKLELDKQEGETEVGITRLKWLADVENDWRELKMKRWKQKANNGEEFACVVK